MELVKEVIVNLAQDLKKVREMEAERFHSTSVPIDHFLRKDQITSVRFAPIILLPKMLTRLPSEQKESSPSIFVSICYSRSERRVWCRLANGVHVLTRRL